MKVAIELSLLHTLLELVSTECTEDREEVVSVVEAVEKEIADSHDNWSILERSDAKQLAKDFQQVIANIQYPCDEDYELLDKLVNMKLISR
ncbi:hypothetical protein [Vibrio phage JSF12]|uniref:Uncharacterized protein n=2 Tax=Jesfedecavirus TaxID=2560156 RepID=A0A2D0Z896_9CAUD|nr:hypothetical protein FDI98_gp144 [Vibrio phage JSF10]YP_009794725.1 hypothetical protein HOS35_gp042 [Vibrio phage JSF12]ASV43388.1 hypothetical protein [Vibrio phage JSF10]ASV43560.1 hypothetical protein [Vibrio phage JSF12]